MIFTKILGSISLIGVITTLIFFNLWRSSEESRIQEAETNKITIELQKESILNLTNKISLQNEEIEKLNITLKDISESQNIASKENEKNQILVQEKIVKIFSKEIDKSCEGSIQFLREESKGVNW